MVEARPAACAFFSHGDRAYPAIEEKALKEMGKVHKLQDPCPVTPKGEPPKSTAERLIELRGILRAALNDAPPQAIAGLSREYRATIDELERLEGGGDGDPVDQALDSIAARIAAKMPAT